MTHGARNADDSCLVNQTVPAAGVSSPSEHDEKQNPNPTPLPTTQGNQGHLDYTAQQRGPPADSPTSSDSEDSTGVANDDDDEDEADFPEGGLRAWLVVLSSFCCMFCVYGIINSAAVFESYFSTHQLREYDASSIGWIFSTYLFMVFFAAIQVGPVFDRYGPRALVAVGSLLVVASQLILGLCTEYYQIILTYSILSGLGGALLNVPAYGMIAHFFRRRRGFASGVASTAGSIGGIVIPIYLQAALPRLGFAWSTRIIGFMLLFLSAVANLLVRTRLPPSTRRVSVLPDWALFADLKFSLCCAGVWFMEWGIFIPLTFIVSYAAAHGYDDANAAYTLLALLNAGSFFGRCLPGLLADRIGRFNVIVMTNALCAVTVLAFWLPARDSRALLIVFAVTFGFASGSNLGLYPVCIGQLCDARDYGRFYSTALMTGSLGTLTSVPIGGALLGLGHGEQGWQALIVFSALSYVIAMSCFLGARVVATSWRVKEVF